MNQRTSQLARILAHRIKREQLCQRRVAICQRAITATEGRLAELHRQQQALRRTQTAAATVTVQWHQHRQQLVDVLARRIERAWRIVGRLQERARRRQTELVRAAQTRRVTETVLSRITQEACRAARRAEGRQFDNLVRTSRAARTRNSHVITT